MDGTTENKKLVKNNEIDLIQIFKKIWSGRKIIYISIAIFFALGLIIALGTPKEYKSEVGLLVEAGSGSSGISSLLQQFGGLAGVNVGGGTGEGVLKRQIYPDIIRSTPFLLELMNQKITETKYDSTLTIADYLDRYTKSSLMSIFKSYTLGLPGKIFGLFKNKSETEKIILNKNGPIRLTKKQLDIASALSNCIDTKEGNILKISVELQDPFVAAQLADSVVKSLTKYIINYRTQKAKIDLQFIVDRQIEAETKFYKAQQELALYHDRNKNIISASARTEEERLQAEYNLAFNIYNTLSQQLEQAKIKVQEITPIFKILEPAKVPFEKSKPETIIILIEMSVFGIFVGIGITFFKTFKLT